MRPDALRARWRAGEPAFGVWCGIPSPYAAELVAIAGYDWVCVDLQHGMTGLGGLAPVLQSISVTGAAPLVRVAANEAWLIGRALDLGAAGVIVPLVDTAQEAAEAVAACRYPPLGRRSYGQVRTAGVSDEALCVVMCETRAGVEHLDEICSVDGLDGVYVGPRDLALSHGLEPDALEPVITRILETCRRHGVPAGIQAGTGAAARGYVQAGFCFAATASDRDLLARAAAAELAAALGAGEAPLARPPDEVLRASARYV